MSIKSGLKMTKDNLKNMVKVLTALPVRDVLVGWPAEDADRVADTPGDKVKIRNGKVTGGQRDEITNPVLAFVHENGAPELNIPARPALIPGIRDAKPKIVSYFRQAGQYAFNADAQGVERALHAAGIAASTAVKNRISIGPFQALAEATLRARRRRGRTGTAPLQDTGQYRNAVTYVIRSHE